MRLPSGRAVGARSTAWATAGARGTSNRAPQRGPGPGEWAVSYELYLAALRNPALHLVTEQ